jgi:hypothetical protein
VLESQPTPVDRSTAVADLRGASFVHITAPHESKEAAWTFAREVFRAAAQQDAIGVGMPPVEEVGQFTIPPPDAPSRDFQTLHLDFGLPVVPERPGNVARFTALYVDADHAPTTALTRIVSLRRLLGQREWADPERLIARFRRYGTINGGAGGGAGYVEGILARLVEAADDSPTLPDSGTPGFLCGMEFQSLAEEREHFAERSLDLDAVEQRILLGAGELLLFDNLAIAHGRLGIRKPLELHQLCVGHRDLEVRRQAALVGRVLRTFSSEPR